MELWLRDTRAKGLDWDERLEIDNARDWRQAISEPGRVSSVLWPTSPRFALSGRHYLGRRHPHELDYAHDPARNASYRDALLRLAARLVSRLAGARVLFYAPMRGAYPLWQVMAPHLASLDSHPYFPVTSSFVRYPERARVESHRGRPASGRFTHLLELSRLRPLLSGFDVLVYLDEIISGGMMWGHARELVTLGIDRQIRTVVAGLADRHGMRSSSNRARLSLLVERGRLWDFLWEGCEELITEDQRYLLGMHYLDHDLGPHAVPLLDEQGEDFEERALFFADMRAAASLGL